MPMSCDISQKSTSQLLFTPQHNTQHTKCTGTTCATIEGLWSGRVHSTCATTGGLFMYNCSKGQRGLQHNRARAREARNTTGGNTAPSGSTTTAPKQQSPGNTPPTAGRAGGRGGGLLHVCSSLRRLDPTCPNRCRWSPYGRFWAHYISWLLRSWKMFLARAQASLKPAQPASCGHTESPTGEAVAHPGPTTAATALTVVAQASAITLAGAPRLPRRRRQWRRLQWGNGPASVASRCQPQTTFNARQPPA